MVAMNVPNSAFSALIFSVALLFSFITGASAKLNTDPKAVAYYEPKALGGSMLTVQREPMNIIISGLSDPAALTNRGVTNWANSIHFGAECLGIHLGGYQAANLGDGNGVVNQTTILREDYKLPIGTCLQSLIGGNHFRIWRQNGPQSNSGALFLAGSAEETAAQNHDIIPNGYDIGRDDIVKRAIAGQTSFSGIIYTTTVQWLPNLLPFTANEINHNIAVDGRVALLTIDAETMGNGYNCKGSGLCPTLNPSTCDQALSKVVDTTIYRTDTDAASTGVCSGRCGIFVQGPDCQFTGVALKEAYKGIRDSGCVRCGSRLFDDTCLITVNYVSSC